MSEKREFEKNINNESQLEHLLQNMGDDSVPTGFKLQHIFRPDAGIICQIAWSPDGIFLASVSGRTIQLWNTTLNKAMQVFNADNVDINRIAWSPDSKMIASGSGEILKIWDVRSGLVRDALEKYARRHFGFAWSPNGDILASGAFDAVSLRYVYRGGIHNTIYQRSKHDRISEIYNMTWSPDGNLLAAAFNDHIIRVWNTVNLSLVHTLEGHNDSIRDLIWSPNSRMLVSSSDDNTIRIWQLYKERKSLVLEGHTKSTDCLSFSSDMRFLASKSTDGTIRLWLCNSWQTIAILKETSSHNKVAGVAFHPSLPILATLGTRDTIIRIWHLDYNILLNTQPVAKFVHYTTAKIALVGDSGVGKTGLGYRLAHGHFKEHPSTHGQQFWVIAELGRTRADGTECEAVLWDLAGQPDYRLVHALFLDDVNLALVLFDPSNRQEPLKGVEYWLQQLARVNGRVPQKILIGARIDRGAPTLTQQEIDEFCRQYSITGGYIATSALNGMGLTELMERVKGTVLWDDMIATVTTTTFKRIKEYVLALKEDTGRKSVLVSPTELFTRLKDIDPGWSFSDDEMMTAVGHLANHGYVSILRTSSGAKTILLVPELLANLASSIVLEARRNPRGLGALEEDQVLHGEYHFHELDGLNDEERDVLLDAVTVLFLEHNMCFRESLGIQTFLVFPALINQKRPQLEQIEIVDDASYRITGAIENVYAALVVLLGYTNTFRRTNQWQSQAQYETTRGDVCGFRQVAEHEGEIELVLYHGAKAIGSRLLFQGLFEEFLRGRDVSIVRFPRIICLRCKYQQSRSEVIKRVSEGRGFLYCGECGRKIRLPKSGDQIALNQRDKTTVTHEQILTQRRTTFEMALVRVKAILRDRGDARTPSCFISYAWGVSIHERWVRGLATDLQNAGFEAILDQWSSSPGTILSRFISQIDSSDYILVVGTPAYLQKYENDISPAGSIVAAEVDLINQRMYSTEERKKTVIPLLLQGTARTALPPLLRSGVLSNFSDEHLYFTSLFDLILTLYGIHFDHAAVVDLREMLRKNN